MQDLIVVTPENQKLDAILGKTSDQRKQEVLKLSSAVVQVTTPNELEFATGRLREIKRLLSEVEATRQAVKTPVLNLGRKIDQIAEEFCLSLEAEAERIGGNTKKRIKGLIGIFVDAEAERVRKEQERLDQERQQREEAAAAAVREQQRIADEAAEKLRLENQRIENERLEKERNLAAALEESKRLEGLKRQSAEKKANAQLEIEKAKAELEAVNQEKPKVSVNIAQEMAAENKIIETQQALQQHQTIAPPAISRASGLTISVGVDFDIIDAAALYAARPEFFDLVPKRNVIKSAINKNTKLPGLKVWETTKAGTRG